MNIKGKDPTPIDDTIECIEALAQIVGKHNLGKLKISTEDIDIVIEGRPCPPPPPMPMPVQTMAPAFAPGAPGVPMSEISAAPAGGDGGSFITSPIIGTFYAAPSPENPPFVKVGDVISAGDVVCIIESMKLMNEINSELSGKVAEVLVKNGDPVEFGQKLFRIE